MREIQIDISTVERVKAFCLGAWQIEGEIDAVGGRHIVDAKSIMALFSLDLMRPVTIVLHNDDADIAPIEKFIVKGVHKQGP